MPLRTPFSRHASSLLIGLATLTALTACDGGRDIGGGSCRNPLSVAPARAEAALLPVNICAPTEADGLSAGEARLYAGLMAHRASLGLPSIPLSNNLTVVAGRHALDTSHNILGQGGFAPGSNIHSWSDAPYPADHSRPQVMWEAPRRLGTQYCVTAFEISASGFGSVDDVLAGWLASSDHAPVIENTGPWRCKTWQAIGIGAVPKSAMGPAVYHVWFGEARDPTGPPPLAP